MAATLGTLEGRTASVLAARDASCAAREAAAAERVDAERSEKKLLAQWLNGFLAHSPQVAGTVRRAPVSAPSMSAIDLAFSRFALNMAIAAGDTPPVAMLQGRERGARENAPPFRAREHTFPL